MLSIEVSLSLNHLKTRGIGSFKKGRGKEPFVHQQARLSKSSITEEAKVKVGEKVSTRPKSMTRHGSQR